MKNLYYLFVFIFIIFATNSYSQTEVLSKELTKSYKYTKRVHLNAKTLLSAINLRLSGGSPNNRELNSLENANEELKNAEEKMVSVAKDPYFKKCDSASYHLTLATHELNLSMEDFEKAELSLDRLIYSDFHANSNREHFTTAKKIINKGQLTLKVTLIELEKTIQKLNACETQ